MDVPSNPYHQDLMGLELPPLRPWPPLFPTASARDDLPPPAPFSHFDGGAFQFARPLPHQLPRPPQVASRSALDLRLPSINQLFAPPAPQPLAPIVRLCQNLQRQGSCSTRNCPESHDIQARWCFQCNLPMDDEMSHLQSQPHAQALEFHAPEPTCPLCDVAVYEEDWKAHIKGSHHTNLVFDTIRTSDGEPAAVHPVWKRVPPPGTVASCGACTVDFLDWQRYRTHCGQETHHLRMKMAHTGRILREALTTKGYVSVSHESGVVNFGEISWEAIEAGRETVTTHIKILATSARMSLLAVLLHASSENKALGRFECGLTDPIELKKNQPVFVPITFTPKKSNGKFADKMELTFMRDDDEGTTFTVLRDVEASVVPIALSPVETGFPEDLAVGPRTSEKKDWKLQDPFRATSPYSEASQTAASTPLPTYHSLMGDAEYVPESSNTAPDDMEFDEAETPRARPQQLSDLDPDIVFVDHEPIF